MLAFAMIDVLFALPVALAQTPPKIPGNVEPGRRPRRAPSAPAAPLALKWTIELPPGPTVPERLANQVLELKGLIVDGAKVYRQKVLRGIFNRHLGKEITFGEFYAIARAIQARYHRDGYLLSFAYVPPQKVKDGVFRIAVVEGFVSSVTVEGVDGKLKQGIERILAPIAGQRPLTTQTLERYMLLVNDLPGVAATGVLQPAKKVRGASDMVVKVSRRPVDGHVSADNRGSEFVGPWRGAAGIGFNSLLGRGERVSLDANIAVPTEELLSVRLKYGEPLSLEGLRIDIAGGYVSSEPGSTLAALDVETKSYSGDVDVTYPLIRTRGETLRLGAGLSFLDTEVNWVAGRLSNDRLRTVRARLTYNRAGFLGGGNGLVLGFTQAVPILGASDADDDATSRDDADEAFTKITLDVTRTQPLFRGVDLVLAAAGQYARSPLPAAMEFSLGGSRFGRGYDSGEITGEDGVAISAEIGYSLFYRKFFVRRVRPYGFYDFGQAWDEGAGGGRSLASAGAGVRLRLVRGLRLNAEYARPLTRTPDNASDRDGRFFVFLSFTL